MEWYQGAISSPAMVRQIKRGLPQCSIRQPDSTVVFVIRPALQRIDQKPRLAFQMLEPPLLADAMHEHDSDPLGHVDHRFPLRVRCLTILARILKYKIRARLGKVTACAVAVLDLHAVVLVALGSGRGLLRRLGMLEEACRYYAIGAKIERDGGNFGVSNSIAR
jgi:hypothetical protein